MRKKRIIMTVFIVILAVITLAEIILWRIDRKRSIRERETGQYHNELFGERVYIFSPEDDPTEVQKIIDSIYEKQEANQFGDERYAFYFLPGEYEDGIKARVGFYTQFAGLGTKPVDTSVERVECLARWLGDDSNHNACCNFWRGVENLELRENSVWAVSQATYMRRVQADGALFLHDDYGWCSGGFLSDSVVGRLIDSGSQQQWCSRNCTWNTWLGENWNMVFVGVPKVNTPRGAWPYNPYTKIEKTDVIREKPFLVYDKKHGYGVYVPRFREDSVGISWADENEAEWINSIEKIDETKDCIVPISCFYVAKPGDTAREINEALAEGKSLVLTPGIYELDETINVTGKNQICLGMGLATLVNTKGGKCLEVSDESGVIVAGILFDAHESVSEIMMQVTENQEEEKQVPISLSDLFFRVGGCYTNNPAKTNTCLVIDANHVVGDNFWIWRADHGDQVAWDKNEAKTGIRVNGDDVTIYALMVEHFEEYQTVWNGNGGRIYMYQCEIPYDVPKQSLWMSHDGQVNGYASIRVAEEVQNFEGYGLGIYLYNRDAQVTLHTAVEVPDTPGVSITNICTVLLTGYPGMEHIVNEAGKPVLHPGERQILLNYENGVFK